MFRDVTIGQFYNVDSIVHRLDPRAKIRFCLAFILMAILDRNLPLFGVLTLILAVAIVLSKVPVGHILRGSKGLYIFIAVCSCINTFTTMGSTVVKIGVFDITQEGLIKSGFVFWRMVLIILMSSLMMYTTTPSQLTDGFEKCFHLSGDIAMAITIALRFIPVLFDELRTIMKAQEARGACFDKGGLIRRIKSMIPVMIPLFQSAIRKAGNLGDAMDARCYTGGKSRTKLRRLEYRRADAFVYLVMLVMLTVCIVLIVNF